MDLSSSADGPSPTGEPGIDADTAELLQGMGAERAALSLRLGIMVQRAAEVEYVLHGLYAHLGDTDRLPYSDDPRGNVGGYIDKSLSRLAQIPKEQIPDDARQTLLHDLALCRERFDRRNLYIHGCWSYDHDERAWRVIKGARSPKRAVFPLVYSEDVEELAMEFVRLGEKLIVWDAQYYGTPGDVELRHPWVSSKRIG